MRFSSLTMDVRYGLRGIRRSPLFAASVSATIGLGLGVLCSAFTVVNAYLLRPIDLPNPRALYALSWDTSTSRRQPFSLEDVEALRSSTPHFSELAATREVQAMQGGFPLYGRLVTGNYFQMLGGQPLMGRTLDPRDAPAPGGEAVVVLSYRAWRSRFGANPDIVGTQVTLGRQRFDVVGVMPQGFGLSGDELVGFWIPLTMAGAFGLPDPWSQAQEPSLTVVGRLRDGATESQVRLWFDAWLRERFPAGSERAPIASRLESLATRIPLTGVTLTLFTLIVGAFGLVLLVACANVMNLMLARGFSREREVAVRLSLGASRWLVIRQLIVEALVLGVPAAAVGLTLTLAIVRVFPTLIVATFPEGPLVPDVLLVPLEPDARVMTLLFVATVVSTVLVSLMPAVRITRVDLVRASKGEVALDTRRSRLRTALVALQIGVCVLFLVGAGTFIKETRRIANPDTGLSYERVVDVRIAPRLRAALAERLAADPSVESVGAAWRPPLSGFPMPIGVVASTTRNELNAGFMVVSSDYFPTFDIDVIRGRTFTLQETGEGASVALVSAAAASRLWPGLDPIGQTLDIIPQRGGSQRLPSHTRVRIVGVAEDVVSSLVPPDTDRICVYFPTGFGPEGGLSILVRGRSDPASLRRVVSAAASALEPETPFQFFAMREMVSGIAWVFGAFSATAAFLGTLGLLLAFSGTYAVVAFLVAQRTREFGVRMALGATVQRLVAGMLREMLKTTMFGLGPGLLVALGIGRALSGTLELIPAISASPYVAGIAIVLVATMTAALLPSIRAARIDPSRALRVE